MRGGSFRFYYVVTAAFLALSACFLVGYDRYSANFRRFLEDFKGKGSDGQAISVTIALADEWGRISYRQVEAAFNPKGRAESALKALFSFRDSGSELRNYINPSARLLDFRMEGSKAYVSVSAEFKDVSSSRLAVSYAQLKATIKAEHPDLESCAVIYPDSVMEI